MAAATGASAIRAMVTRAFEQLQGHERLSGGNAFLNQLLENAPLDAEIWDVLGHTLKVRDTSNAALSYVRLVCLYSSPTLRGCRPLALPQSLLQ
jgi:hypothetical protein